MLHANSHARILNATNNYPCNRRIGIHRLSLCTAFIEPHLLNHGYQARGSVRDLARTYALEATLNAIGAATSKLDWVQTSLPEPDNWSAAIDGCDAIFHTETPLPIIQAKNQLTSCSLPNRAHQMCCKPPLRGGPIGSY
jgi:hypothetical protein